MKPKHAARKIHPRAPWVAHPEAYSAPQQPQQAPQQPQPRLQPGTLSIGPARPSARMQAHIASIENVTAGPPPRVPASTAMVKVMIDGSQVSVPADWSLAFTSKDNRDVLLAVDGANVLHVLVVRADGQLAELQGLTNAFIDDVLRWKFPRIKR